MNSKNNLIVTGGGTGGHVFAGIAIADAWAKKHPDSSIIFVGAKGGIEEKTVTKTIYPLYLLNLGSLKGVSFKKKCTTLLQLPLAILRAAQIIIQHKPAAVIGVGGYASGPVVLVSRFFSLFYKTKIAILEQNAVPGLTNRILANFVHRVFCAFPDIQKQFPAKKASFTGNPIRKEFSAFSKNNKNPFCVFIFGGSQGALGINTLVLDSLQHLGDLKNKITWIHQTGEKDFERVKKGYEKENVTATVSPFIYNMAEMYQKASLVICRSGSGTLSELAAVQRASILIPFPFAADNHQEKNAQLFVNPGASYLLLQNKSKGVDLAHLIEDLFQNPNKIDKMEKAVAPLFKAGAAEEIVNNLGTL